mmetsp:Transcript_28560/g.58041  ORF Transcript_28560/g.58041 Transcript_28560/m.58041 type:complete len:255 (-) Transcript_28560:205-969(-)
MMKSKKSSVRFAPILETPFDPSNIPPAPLSIIPKHEKSSIWYSDEDIAAFKLSARMIALRIRQSDRYRQTEEVHINSTPGGDRRSSLRLAYNRNVRKARQEIQSSCKSLDAIYIKCMWNAGDAEISDYEEKGLVPRGLEFHTSFYRQRQQKVAVVKLLYCQKKLKGAAAENKSGQSAMPTGSAIDDILACVLTRERKISRELAEAVGWQDFLVAYPEKRISEQQCPPPEWTTKAHGTKHQDRTSRKRPFVATAS